METQNYNNDKLEFRQIVLGHIKRILELSSHELRDTTYITTHANYNETKHQEDTRYSYIQSIENLSFVLSPYFDKEMREVYEDCIDIINGLDYEVLEYCKKEYDIICREINKEDLGKAFVIEMKIRYSKKLFIALNMMLKRNDYLKSSVYGEDKDELISDDDSEGDEE